MMLQSSLCRLLCLLAFARHAIAAGPFLKQLDRSTWVFGNDIWSVTQQGAHAKKLMYKGRDLVGGAVGHYVSYDAGGAADLHFTSASVHAKTSAYLDIAFSAKEGDMHWVIFPDLAGAYQYFVNRGLPDLGEFRTAWRLDSNTFPNGRTDVKDERLPALSEFVAAKKITDDVWRRNDGTYLTKYNWATFVRTLDFHGVYGPNAGSWYISPGKDYFNGNHFKQELMVHRESESGDAAQLNYLHGTHFMAPTSDSIPSGRIWGPWLWYLNDGSTADAEARKNQELRSWPYSWFDNSWYQSRASVVKGTISLSDGRPASGAAVFLGDNNPSKTASGVGSSYYYTAFADAHGAFSFSHVLAGTYGLQAWSNGGAIADVSTSLFVSDVKITQGNGVDTGAHIWKVNNRKRVFQLGELDRKALGFKYGGAPRQHALVDGCPADATFVIGESKISDWCYAQSAKGTVNIEFKVDTMTSQKAVLTVALAGFSSGSFADILINGAKIGTLGSTVSDQGLYRSATTAGEFHSLEFPFSASSLKTGKNTLSFSVTSSGIWRGWMWDSILLEWA